MHIEHNEATMAHGVMCLRIYPRKGAGMEPVLTDLQTPCHWET